MAHSETSHEHLMIAEQGLLTNDTKQLEAKDAPMQYAAILNSHGRYLHDLFLHKQKGFACIQMVIIAAALPHGST